LPKDYFKIDVDPAKTRDCQARALNFIAKIEQRAYKFLEYTDKYNKEGKEAVSAGLKSLTLILDPTANTFLNIYGYSSAFNVGYLELRQKLGKVIVKKLGSYQAGDIMYKQFNEKGEPAHVIAKEGQHTYN
jgi:hypothetical protein